jgi:hypothetical protein
MITPEACIPIPFALVLVQDSRCASVPASMQGQLIALSPCCIAVGSRPEADGQTRLLLGDAHVVDPGDPPLGDCAISTPSRHLTVQTAQGTIIISTPVPETTTVVRIWANHPTEPDELVFGLVPAKG